MGKRLNSDEMQTIFEILQKSYDVYGPKNLSGNRMLFRYRYSSLWSAEQLGRTCLGSEVGLQFQGSAVSSLRDDSLFTEDEMKTADGVARQRLIFLKSCDFML